MPALDTPVIGLGAATPLGRSVWATAAAVRAGMAGFSEHPFMTDTMGEPIRWAPAPWLSADLAGTERFLALLLPAIDEALAGIPDHAKSKSRGARFAIALGLPRPRPGIPIDLEGEIHDRLLRRYAQLIESCALFPIGHAAGLYALDAAVNALKRGSLDACVVAAVDSYADPETLVWLEESDQLHGAGPLNNAWGFIPGEAAGALLLTTPELLSQLGEPALGRLVGLGLGRERNLIKSRGSVCLGEGLTAAFLAAMDALPEGAKIQNTICDMNGESYRADEFGFAALRVKQWIESATDFCAPADCWGDIGAAGGPLHVAIALIGHHKRYGRGPFSLVWASSESGERGAATIRATDSETA